MNDETADAMTAEEHIAEARRFAAQAEDRGSHWDRSVDLQAAQVHATLAQTLTAETLIPMMARLTASLLEPESPPAAEAPPHTGETP